MPSWNVLAQLVVVFLATAPPIFGGEFKPVCGGQSCPSVAWIDAAAGQPTSFTLRGSAKSGFSNYVAFAFASGQTMGSAQLVVDCYDVQGVAMIATSRNTQGYANSPSTSDGSKVTNRNATRNQGMLNCVFSMALPNSTVHILISEGQMDASSSQPLKTYHGGNKFPSSASYTFPTPATATIATATASPKNLTTTITTATSKPSTTAAKPVTTVPKPVTTVPMPVSTVRVPATTVPMPVSTVRVPATTVPMPVTTVRVPATTVPKPVTTVSKPVTTVSKPVTTVPMPVSTVRVPATTVPITFTTVSKRVTTVSKPVTTVSIGTTIPSMAITSRTVRSSSDAPQSSTASSVVRPVTTGMAGNAVTSAVPSASKMTDVQTTGAIQPLTRTSTPSAASFPSSVLSNSSSSRDKPDVTVTQDARRVTVSLDSTTSLMVADDSTTIVTGNSSYNITAGSSQSKASTFGPALDATSLAAAAALALTLRLY